MTYLNKDIIVKNQNPTEKFLDRPTAPGPSDAKRKAAKVKRKKK